MAHDPEEASMSVSPLPLYIVDAFAERPFTGNPAAVCLLDGPLACEEWAQALAAEMNLSETAFVEPEAADGSRRLRWFTPTMEVSLCGHATVATAHALADSGSVEPSSIVRFATASGEVTAELVPGAPGRVVLDFPARPATACEPPEGLVDAFGLAPRWVGRSGENDVLFEVDRADWVQAAEPDLALLASVDARGVILTARSGDDSSALPMTQDGRRPDFVSRFFAPQSGVPEDPVTGSAHCTLAPHWARRLGQDRMCAYQASRRGGFVEVELRGDRVRLGGGAVTTLRGTLSGPAARR